MTPREILALHKALTEMNPDNPPISIEQFLRARGLVVFGGNSRQRRTGYRKAFLSLPVAELQLLLDPAAMNRPMHRYQ